MSKVVCVGRSRAAGMEILVRPKVQVLYMKRRNFLKLLAVSPIAPAVLCAKGKLTFQRAMNEAVAERLSEMRRVSQDIYGRPDMLFPRQPQPLRLFTEEEKAEHCMNHPFCKGCFFSEKYCCLHDIDYEILWKAACKNLTTK